MASAPALPLWSGAEARRQPRDKHGRFKRVQHSAQRRLVLARAALIRAELGLPADPRLEVRG